MLAKPKPSAGKQLWQTHQVQTEAWMGNDALADHVVDNGRVLVGRGDIAAEAQAHDARGAGGRDGEAQLLVGDFMAPNGDGVVEVIARDAPLVEVGDVEAALVDERVRLAVSGVD